VHLTLVVLEQLAKDLRGGHELRRRELLIANNQHVMTGKSAVEGRTGVGVDAAIEIDAADLGAGVRGQWGQREIHLSVLPPTSSPRRCPRPDRVTTADYQAEAALATGGEFIAEFFARIPVSTLAGNRVPLPRRP
jgi:hypothetical protein